MRLCLLPPGCGQSFFAPLRLLEKGSGTDSQMARRVFALLVYAQTGESPAWLFSFPPGHAGEGCVYSLLVIYLIWLGVVAALYPLCRWFAGVKRRRSDT